MECNKWYWVITCSYEAIVRYCHSDSLLNVSRMPCTCEDDCVNKNSVIF